MAAFTRETLSGGIGAGSAAPKLYTYATNDTEAEVLTADYFLGAYQILKAGDMIFVAFDKDGTIGAAAITVASSSSTTVTTAYIQVA